MVIQIYPQGQDKVASKPAYRPKKRFEGLPSGSHTFEANLVKTQDITFLALAGLTMVGPWKGEGLQNHSSESLTQTWRWHKGDLLHGYAQQPSVLKQRYVATYLQLLSEASGMLARLHACSEALRCSA